ncbi:MAG: glycosyltransferase family 2 protein [Candidatus Margulisiibacteriota bacterium]|jgi:hypothetical protein
MAKETVAIIVLNWNGWQDTIECLASLKSIHYEDCRVIVVDNGSTDGSVGKIKNWLDNNNFAKRPVIIETHKNLGYAAGNNAGLRYALNEGFDYYWILNNDTVVDPEALKELVMRMKEKPGAGICGSMILYYHEPEKIAAIGGGFYDKWLGQAVHPGADRLFDPHKIDQYIKQERKINYIEGASTLVSRDFLTKIGLMNEEYFLFFEEIDWATRARGKFALAIAPKSLVYHKCSASVKKKEKEAAKGGGFSPLFDYYNTRNRLLFSSKYYPYTLPTVYLSILGYIIDKLRVGAWKNAGIIAGQAINHLKFF